MPTTWTPRFTLPAENWGSNNASVAQVQRVSFSPAPVSDTFRLVFNGADGYEYSDPINWNDTPFQVMEKLSVLPSLVRIGIGVTGSINSAPFAISITLNGYMGVPPLFLISSNYLNNFTCTVTVALVTQASGPRTTTWADRLTSTAAYYQLTMLPAPYPVNGGTFALVVDGHASAQIDWWQDTYEDMQDKVRALPGASKAYIDFDYSNTPIPGNRFWVRFDGFIGAPGVSFTTAGMHGISSVPVVLTTAGLTLASGPDSTEWRAVI